MFYDNIWRRENKKQVTENRGEKRKDENVEERMNRW
jgi:hypothetical protein